MNKLKLDNFVKRSPDRSARNIPTQPLTEEQKNNLADIKGECWKKCRNAYVVRMKKSALLSDFEEDEDLVSEAYIAMWNILNKFDLSKCGEVAEYDVAGDKNPKTLEFYFYNYFSRRVNFIACESRQGKKQRGVGPADSMDEVNYNPADNESNYSEFQHKYAITGQLLHDLKKRDHRFRRFFVQMYQIQLTQRELREEYGDAFNALKAQAQDFISSVKEKHNREKSK